MDKRSQFMLQFFSDHGGFSLRDLGVKLDTNGEEYAKVVLSLRKQGLLAVRPKYEVNDEDSLSMEDAIHITQEGRAALEKSLHDQALEKRGEIMELATLAVAAVTLVVSVISLVLQLLGK